MMEINDSDPCFNLLESSILRQPIKIVKKQSIVVDSCAVIGSVDNGRRWKLRDTSKRSVIGSIYQRIETYMTHNHFQRFVFQQNLGVAKIYSVDFNRSSCVEK